MKKYISLRDYGKTPWDATNIRNKIRENLGKEIFNYQDFATLQFQALRQFSDVRRYIKNQPDLISKAVDKIMGHFYFPKAVIKRLNAQNQFVAVSSNKEETNLDLFNYWILGFDSTPFKELQYLKEHVESHLRFILKLIEKYEDVHFIQFYNQDKKNPGDNNERMMLDFYKRCLRERDLILKYYLNGIEDRAIFRANTKVGLSSVFSNTAFYDFPYRSWMPYREEYFDYEQINCSAHRCYDISIGEDLEEIYDKNKQQFYKKLFKIKSTQQIFSNIDFFYNHIPCKNDRLPIFLELEKLFKSKNWLSFFALTLPQVEGLFTEMLNTINPNDKSRSLSEKVEKVRPSYNLSETYFDYYQYKITDLRNKFAHTGFEIDLKLKCFDLLTDLEHIVQVYYELDHPMIKIKRLIKQSNPDNFIGYREFAQFFELFNKLHPTQKNQIRSEFQNFVNLFLTVNCQLEYILNEASESTEKLIKILIHSIEKATNSSEIANEFEIKKLNDVKFIIKNNKKELLRLFRFENDKLNDLYFLKIFNNALKKHFNNWASIEKESFMKVMEESDSIINNLLEIKNFAEKNEDKIT